VLWPQYGAQPTPVTDTRIRPAEPRDAESLFALLKQFATSYQPRRAAFDAALPQLLASPTVDLLVAEQRGQVVGYALAHSMLTLYANGAVVELQELMVAPEHRKRGIGRQLVESILDRAARSGAAEATVPTRRARDFYLRLGFEETATYLKRTLAKTTP